MGGGIANFTDVAATFNGIIRALKEKVSVYFYGLFLVRTHHPSPICENHLLLF